MYTFFNTKTGEHAAGGSCSTHFLSRHWISPTLLPFSLGLKQEREISTSSVGGQGSDLGVQMLQQVALLRPRQNLLVSPHGVASVLGLLLLGAGGDTGQQILTALRYEAASGLDETLGDLHRSLDKSGQGATVTVSSGLFAQKGLEMKVPFLSAIRRAFRCESRNLNFANRVSAARTINVWIRDRTNGKISTLVRPDMLDGALTRLVAVNAIYFKGLWKSRFRREDTKMGKFTTGDGSEHEVPMMSQVSVLNTGTASTPAGLRYSVIELPYHGDAHSMLIAVPPVGTPLSALLPHVGVAAVRRWAELLSPSLVPLSLPRFSVEAELDMKIPLLALNVTDIFDQHKADFRHICTEPLYVSKAVQRAKMEVNEDGTKASVATASVLLTRSSPPPVTIDRPFLFLIRHNPTGTLLFMGLINDPLAPCQTTPELELPVFPPQTPKIKIKIK
ncbi:glia-derived nexin-like isoform X3 [Anguilla anguilla]|uniref:glia-derived nexin-like isoform X3 n=1 Tax=Anguilla anguilla TaxID=7936 RepID=UPI0015AC8B27|nr:glia-derived nexin-like isoform X3 [Anguilla anguilla]